MNKDNSYLIVVEWDNGEEEVVDSFDNAAEAYHAVGEYRMAFGQSARSVVCTVICKGETDEQDTENFSVRLW